ncbi:MAG: hypothetical protein EA353_14140 [Puniceicoccaceae bacterium]|nr:MAG: hypothetical protein EA353_14140 [Puniceicoccaceae bacterium]
MSKNAIKITVALLFLMLGLSVGRMWPTATESVDADAERDHEPRESPRDVEAPDPKTELPLPLEQAIVTTLRSWHDGETPDDMILFALQVEAWAQADPARAFEALQNMKHLRPGIYFATLGIVAKEWGKLNPEEMLSAADQLTHSYASYHFLLQGMTGAMHVDPEFAMEWLGENRHLDQANSFTFSLLAELSTIDPLEAFERAALLNDPQLKGDIQGTIAVQYAETSPEAAFTWASGLEPGRSRELMIEAVMEHMSYLHPEKAIEYAADLPDDIFPLYRDQITHKVIAGLAATHPQEASQLLETLEAPNQYDDAVQTLAERWGLLDYEAATEWVQSISDPYSKHLAERSLMVGAALSSPERAMQIAGDMQVSEESSDISSFLATQWARVDPAGASEWMLSLSDRDIPAGGVRETLQTWAQADSEAAIEFVQSNAGRFQERALVPVFFGDLAARDPQHAMETAMLMQDPTDRYSAVTSVLQATSKRNPTQALEMIESFAEPEIRDWGVMAVVSEIAKLTPREAFKHAQGVTDPAYKYQSVLATVLAVSEYDRDLARQMIDQSGLPPDQKQIAYEGIE